MGFRCHCCCLLVSEFSTELLLNSSSQFIISSVLGPGAGTSLQLFPWVRTSCRTHSLQAWASPPTPELMKLDFIGGRCLGLSPGPCQNRTTAGTRGSSPSWVQCGVVRAGFWWFLVPQSSLREVNSFSGCLQHTPKMSQGPTLFSCGVMGK